MLDWKGSNAEKKYRTHVKLEYIKYYPMMVASNQVISIEFKEVDRVF